MDAPRIRKRRRTTARRHASCSAWPTRSPITTADRSPSIRWRVRARRSSACSTSDLPTAAAAATRRTWRRTSLSIFGKILRIDPLGKNSRNGKYGIPASNPFVKTADALGEIYSYGHRNPQRFCVGSEERQHVRSRDRSEHQRGDQSDRRRRQLRLERLGRQLQVLQPGSQHRGPARRFEDALSDRGIRSHRSDPAASRRRHRHLRLSREGDCRTDRHADLRRQPER